MGEIADFSAVWLQTLVHIVVVRQNSRKITLPRLESLYFWSYGGSQKDGANHFLHWDHVMGWVQDALVALRAVTC